MPAVRVFPAHIRTDGVGRETVQSVTAHCRKTAEDAAAALSPIGLSASGYLVGLLHDMGKMTEAFAAYLRNAADGQRVRRGSVNHTFAAVRFLLTHYHAADTKETAFFGIACELLALAVGSHHGLFDCVNEENGNGFVHRLTKPDTGSEEATENYLDACAPETEIAERFACAAKELVPLLERIWDEMVEESASDLRFEEETAFYCGLLARLLLSAVIEGDRRDTAEFMDGVRFPIWGTQQRRELFETCLRRTEQRIDSFPQISAIDRARRAISDRCRAEAALPGGICRLNVPTARARPCPRSAMRSRTRRCTASSGSFTFLRCSASWSRTPG